jgi:hypothetical protein
MRRRAFLEMIFSPEELEHVNRDEFAAEAESIFGRDLADQPNIVMKQVRAISKHDISSRLASIQTIPSLVISAQHDRMPRQRRAGRSPMH